MQSLPLVRQSYTDRQRYMIFVLWLHGSTQSAIARRVGLRPKQVAGIIARSEYTNRASMSADLRQKKLNELRAIRAAPGEAEIDGGALPIAAFTARKTLGGMACRRSRRVA